MFQGDVEFSFDSHNEVVLSRLLKIFHSFSKIFKKTWSFFFSEKGFSSKYSYGNIESSLGNPAEFSPTKGRIFLDQRWNMSRRTQNFQVDIKCF